MLNATLIVYVQFFYVLDAFFKSAEGRIGIPMSVKDIFKQELINLGLPSTKRPTVEEYFKRPRGELNINFSARDGIYKSSIQDVYELFCTKIGPVETDRLFGLTVERVSKTQAAQYYSPYSFM